MSLSLVAILTLAIAVGISLILVPLVRTASRRAGIVDRPDPERKLHGKETALCGGLAIFIATASAVWIVLFVWGGTRGAALALPEAGLLENRYLVLALSAAAMMLVGLVDDAFTLRGRQKLLAQIFILSCVIGSGTVISSVSLLGFEMQLGMFAYPITMLWLLGAVNALNLIDGADGMATTAGLIICGGLSILSLHSGGATETIIAAALAGSLVGFLQYNRPPASIFLGDAGSMLIGLVVGVLATWTSVKGTTVLAAAPVAVLAIPLFDSAIAILRRRLTGRSIYATDRAHLHHLLSARFGPRGMLVVVAVLCLATTIAAVLSVLFARQWIALMGVLVVLGALVMTRSFGHAELSLLIRRLANFAEGLITPSKKCEERTQVRHVQLQGNRQWIQVWEGLVEFAQKHELSQVKMDLSISWMHEGYHGVWNSVRLPDKVDQMHLRIPLVAFDPKLNRDRNIGRLEIIARGDHPRIYDTLDLLADRLADLRPQLTELVIASDPEFSGGEAAPAVALPPGRGRSQENEDSSGVDRQEATSGELSYGADQRISGSLAT
jgi:UDP-GlcNAc:undecaprenyl-phosphate GlcNAc-1-phosphate transferase